MRNQVIIVAEPSIELELALDALDELRDNVRIFSSPAEAGLMLLSSARLTDTVVVAIQIGEPEQGVEHLVARLRRAPTTANIPIVLWGSAAACRAMSSTQRPGVNSFVSTTEDPQANATLLARMIHYWAVVNQPPGPADAIRNMAGGA